VRCLRYGPLTQGRVHLGGNGRHIRALFGFAPPRSNCRAKLGDGKLHKRAVAGNHYQGLLSLSKTQSEPRTPRFPEIGCFRGFVDHQR
jgi:hypothetical protein